MKAALLTQCPLDGICQLLSNQSPSLPPYKSTVYVAGDKTAARPRGLVAQLASSCGLDSVACTGNINFRIRAFSGNDPVLLSWAVNETSPPNGIRTRATAPLISQVYFGERNVLGGSRL